MLDTVSRTTLRTLRPEVLEAVRKSSTNGIPSGWKFSSFQHPSGLKLIGNHPSTGMRVTGGAGELRTWIVSLPRVLHGFNGIQIKSDNEYRAALDKVHAILSEVAEAPRAFERFSRVDVALNLDYAKPESLVLALRNAPHPWIRRATEQYASGSIRYPGSQVVFTAYWKRPPIRTGTKSKAWLTPGVLRLEIQLKNAAKIAQFFGTTPDNLLTELPSVMDIYLAFRAFVTQFQRSHVRLDGISMAGLIALSEYHDFRMPGGASAMEWHRASSGQSAHAKMRAKVAALVPQFLSIDWAELLPADSIPATVDVFLDGTTISVPGVGVANEVMGDGKSSETA